MPKTHPQPFSGTPAPKTPGIRPGPSRHPWPPRPCGVAGHLCPTLFRVLARNPSGLTQPRLRDPLRPCRFRVPGPPRISSVPETLPRFLQDPSDCPSLSSLPQASSETPWAVKPPTPTPHAVSPLATHPVSLDCRPHPPAPALEVQSLLGSCPRRSGGWASQTCCLWTHRASVKEFLGVCKFLVYKK